MATADTLALRHAMRRMREYHAALLAETHGTREWSLAAARLAGALQVWIPSVEASLDGVEASLAKTEARS